MNGRKRPGRRWLWRLILIAVVAYGGLYAWTGHLLTRAQAAYEAGRTEEASEILERARSWRVRRNRVQDALGVVSLEAGRTEEAVRHLEAARRGFFHPAAFGERKVLVSFLERGLYEPARIYAEHRRRIETTPANGYYLGVALNGLNELDGAGEALAGALEDPDWKERAAAQQALIDRKRKTGRSDYLFDRNRTPLAAIDLDSGRAVLAVPDLAPLLTGSWGPALQPRDTANQVRLTLDLEMQRAAEAALGSQRGALVVLDVSTGGLLAAASQPVAGEEGAPPTALAGRFEPGSIIKMLTLSAALRRGADVASIFPMKCPGWITLDGEIFRDWTTHGTVESEVEAVAVSCNIAFARIAGLAGRDGVNQELARYHFEQEAQGSDLVSTDFGFGLGHLLPEDTAHPNYALARRAEGLDSLDITPIHAAVLAAGLARGGQAPLPHLVREKTNLMGGSYYEAAPAEPGPAALTPEQQAVIVRAMSRAVTDERGTARRARVEGLSAAMKTGTSGTRPPGLDGLLIGFAPAEKPAIAWALVAQGSGKAELVGARIVKDFLERIRGRLK